MLFRSADQVDLDSVPGDGTGDDHDVASLTVTPRRVGPDVDLELSLTVSPASILVDSDASLTLTVTNRGQNEATGVVISFVVPNALDLDSSGTPGFSGSAWSVGSVPAGTQRTATVTVTGDRDGTYSISAEVSSVDQPDVDSTPGDGTGDDHDQVALAVLEEEKIGRAHV